MTEENKVVDGFQQLIDSKAGKLEDSLSHPMSLINFPDTNGEILVDLATRARNYFLKQLETIKDTPDDELINNKILNEVRDKAEEIDWQNEGQLQELVDFVRELLKS